jgi:DNA (cytosine-5)-methyltransferase 1
MNHGSLFSGIGGFDLAAEWMGWENIFHCEWNEFGQKVLKYYWPKAISYHDITKTDFSIHRGKIDILTGGFPCQPYSAAGKRLGKEDDRHLWPEMLRAIREIQPTWVVGENVLGLVNWNGGLVFDEVQADLEAEGYEVQPYVLPAVSVNAPHRRDRVWFVAKNTMCNGFIFGQSNKEGSEIRQQRNTSTGSSERIYLSEGTASDTDSNSRRSAKSNFNEEREHIQCRTSRFSIQRITSDTESGRQRGIRNKSEEAGTRKGNQSLGSIRGVSNASDSYGKMLEHRNGKGETIGRTIEKERIKSFNSTGKWETFPTQSPICTRDDGLSSRLDGITFPKWRNESIKAGGNAIVPQVVYQIFKAIEQYETPRHTQAAEASRTKKAIP